MKFHLVYRTVNGSAPEYLQNDVIHVSQTHRYSIVYLLFVFLPLRVQKKATFTHSAIKLLNELPKEIKNINTCYDVRNISLKSL